MGWNDRVNFNELEGKTLTKVTGLDQYSDHVTFECDDGSKYVMLHHQDCCESVSIEDVVGDVEDIIGSPVMSAEEVNGDADPIGEYEESYTWTYYKINTQKGGIVVRWYGSSNGYYSESVDFEKVE